MLVIKLSNGNVYPAETCVWRTTQVTTGGYQLTHLTVGSPTIAVGVAPAVAPTGAELGYIGKSGRFVAYTEPAA
jgi:hypothetical protein